MIPTRPGLKPAWGLGLSEPQPMPTCAAVELTPGEAVASVSQGGLPGRSGSSACVRLARFPGLCSGTALTPDSACLPLGQVLRAGGLRGRLCCRIHPHHHQRPGGAPDQPDRPQPLRHHAVCCLGQRCPHLGAQQVREGPGQGWWAWRGAGGTPLPRCRCLDRGLGLDFTLRGKSTQAGIFTLGQTPNPTPGSPDPLLPAGPLPQQVPAHRQADRPHRPCDVPDGHPDRQPA